MNQWLTRAGADLPWQEEPLGFLLGRDAAETFFRDHFEQKPLRVAHGEPDRFADLLSIAAIDAFLDGADLRQGMLNLVRHPVRIDESRYLSQDGTIIPSAVAEEYLNGATVILPQLHDSMPSLGALCRALERRFCCHVQTNVYLTPPGHQGFATHYDNHDVLVLQLAGAKSWSLYSTPVVNPFRGEGFAPGEYEPGEISDTLVLEAGDCLYLPRGVMHDAPNVGDAPSLHITVGLITKTWADLMLEAVSEVALSEPAFRRSLPPGYADGDFDREAARADFRVLANLVAEKAQMDGAFDLLAHEFLRTRRPEVAGVLAAGPEAPDETDRFRRRPVVPFQLADDDGKLALIGPGGDLYFDDGEQAALERAISGQSFGASDLSCADPRRLIRKLWANGYLEKVEVGG